MKKVIVLIGAGQIGQAIARRVGKGKHVVLADMRPENANAAAEIFRNAGFEVSVATVDVSSRQAVQALVATATNLGEVTGLIHAAGVSPSQASPATISRLISMVRRSSSKNSARSLRAAAPASSLPRYRVTAYPRCRVSKIMPSRHV